MPYRHQSNYGLISNDFTVQQYCKETYSIVLDHECETRV